MNTKLTLTIEREIMESAKIYAQEHNRSLSDIIEAYLKTLIKKEKTQNTKRLHPAVKSLKGSFKISKDINYKKELEHRLEKKYL